MQLKTNQRNNYDIYKIYSIGNHFVGSKYTKKYGVENDEEGCITVSNYVSELSKEIRMIKIKNSKTPLKLAMDEAYDVMLQQDFVKIDDKINFIIDYCKKLGFEVSPLMAKELIKRKIKNAINRKRRFKRKALNNNFNYFTTITFDSNILSADLFVTKLKKFLSNLHCRYGINYMGVFELSSKDRIHLHALFYIPDTAPKKFLQFDEISDFSIKRKKIYKRNENKVFRDKFGINDWQKVNENDLIKGNGIDYILKYLEKTNAPIFYSRGLREFFYIKTLQNNIVCKLIDNEYKYLFRDDLMKNYKDKDENIVMCNNAYLLKMIS